MSGSPDPEILNIEQAAELLGVSVKTFHKVLHSEELPARKVGREWKFSRRALIDWVGSGKSSDFVRDGRSSGVVQPHRAGADPDADNAVREDGTVRRTSGWTYQNTPD